MKKLLTIFVGLVLAALIALLIWGPVSANVSIGITMDSQSGPGHKCTFGNKHCGNVQMVYAPSNTLPGAYRKTSVYAGRNEWVSIGHTFSNQAQFGAIQQRGKIVRARLKNNEQIMIGHLFYEVPRTARRRAIKWSGEPIPVDRKLKLVKGGRRQKVVLKWAYLLIQNPHYLLPPNLVNEE